MPMTPSTRSDDAVSRVSSPMPIRWMACAVPWSVTDSRTAAATQLAEKANIPVITTFLGIGGMPESHDLSYGWLGMHGMFYANMAADGADLVIGVGMRFDDRAHLIEVAGQNLAQRLRVETFAEARGAREVGSYLKRIAEEFGGE